LCAWKPGTSLLSNPTPQATPPWTSWRARAQCASATPWSRDLHQRRTPPVDHGCDEAIGPYDLAQALALRGDDGEVSIADDGSVALSIEGSKQGLSVGNRKGM